MKSLNETNELWMTEKENDNLESDAVVEACCYLGCCYNACSNSCVTSW
ncbi:MAG: hypothetical protein ACLR0A_11180 [Faecalibacillus intestinalis]|jgi:hypothetical protein